MSARTLGRAAHVVLTAGLVTAMVAACGTQFQEDETGDDAATAQDVTLTYWSAWNIGEPQQEIFERLAADYTDETGIEIDVRYLGRDVTTNLINALGTGTGPDLFDAGTRNILDLHERGFVANLDGLLDQEVPGDGGTVGETLAPSIVAAGSSEDGLAILPTYITSSGIWFNAARFPELQEQPPATWEDFIALLDELKANGEVPLGADGSVSGYNMFWFLQAMMRNGGPGSLRALGEDAENWNSDHVLASAQMVQQLVDGGYFQQDYMGTQFPAAQVAWANDEYAFMLNGSYMGGETAELQAEGFEASTFVFPMVDGGYPTIDVTASGLAVNAASENSEAATDFLAFAAQEEYQALYSTEAGFMAAHTAVEVPPALGPLAEAIAAAEVTTGSNDLAPATNPGWWSDVMNPLDDALFSGSISAEEFVAQGYEQTATYLENN
ncbi:ABC transporter substrate-binding protein [Occultella gossypii]|uniref:Carbohydrate ABC transporter substrate-binding protein n=1 Tax=Occultella gossypii TaxID=2800820 RepID=A0ABS7SCT9_9MICO|nr:ABC transporter substrate-binding protein [Occultella gossypii]MBZ2197877.1 carbohydrate ABC transporter substrate-binding protein [Occultella gossypii]